MMKKEPDLSQKSQKEHLVKIIWCMLEKSCFNLLLHIRNFPVIQKNIKNGYQKIYDYKKKQYFTIAKSSHN